MERILGKCLLAGIAAFSIAGSPALAGIIFTFEDAFVQETTVPGVITETFDAGAPSNVIGTYTNATVSPANVFGGANGTPFLDMTGTTVTRLDLNAPQRYFGMWWSAGDFNDQLTIFDGGGVLGVFTVGGDLIPALGPDYYGNPNDNPPPRGNPSEPYAYLNFTTTGTSVITAIEFTQTTSTGGFETDNHSVTDEPIDPPGNPLPGVPDSGTTALLGLLAFGGLGFLRRFMK